MPNPPNPRLHYGARFAELRDMTQREKFSREFRAFLRDFVVGYMAAKPDNIVEFGVKYFSKELEFQLLPPRVIRKPSLKPLSVSKTSMKTLTAHAAKGHRKGISSEVYHPELYDPDDSDTHSEGFKIIKKSEQQYNHITSTIKNVFTIRILDHNIMNKIVAHMRLWRVKKGTFIMKEGLNAEKFFVIEKGTFKETFSSKMKKPSPLPKGWKNFKTYLDVGCFGQLALHYHHILTNTVVAETDGEVWYIERNNFRRLVLRHSYQKHKDFAEICSEIVLLSDLDEDMRSHLYDAMVQTQFPTKTMIWKEGDKALGMYFLQLGNVKTYNLNRKGEQTNIRYYVNGEYFGEIEILGKTKRTCNAVTIGRTKAAFLPADCFDRVLGSQRVKMEENIKEQVKVYEEGISYWHGAPNTFQETIMKYKTDKHLKKKIRYREYEYKKGDYQYMF